MNFRSKEFFQEHYPTLLLIKGLVTHLILCLKVLNIISNRKDKWILFFFMFSDNFHENIPYKFNILVFPFLEFQIHSILVYKYISNIDLAKGIYFSFFYYFILSLNLIALFPSTLIFLQLIFCFQGIPLFLNLLIL